MSDNLPALYEGVSQQSPMVRSKGQMETLVNSWLSLADGLGKRPPTEHVARLLPTAPTNALIHDINRDTTERYSVIVANGVIRVFDLTGAERTVYAPGGWGYLAGVADYSADLSLFTVADYTFVVNRKKVCAMSPAGTDVEADPTFYLWINRDYGTDAQSQPYGPGYAYQYGANAEGSYAGEVQRFDKLPTTAAEGAIYKVTGDDTSGFVSYYVRRTGGVWDETVRPGLVNQPDAATMPHGLVRQLDGSFLFAPFSWAPRRVGDEVTNPSPGFIGRTIRKVFFDQNRLAFIYDENVSLSVAGDFGNFWRMTVLDLLDSDVIDVSATTTKVSILYDAAPWNGGIILTSDQTQFSMSNGEAGITPASIAIKPVTSYGVNVRAGLAVSGSEVYFSVERSGFAALREYALITGNAESTSAADITAHVPRYVPAGVSKIVPAEDLNALFVLTDGAPSRVYVYQYYWLSSTEKAMSAWHYWDLGPGARVLSGTYVGGFLLLVVARADGLMLEKVSLQSGAQPPEAPLQVYLDRRAVVTGQYNSMNNTTVFVLPYQPVQATFRLVRGNAFTARPGSLVDPASYEWLNATTVRVPGNEAAGPALAGGKYELRFRFSQQFPRKSDGTAVASGRLQLRTMTVSYQGTGFFRTEVAPYGLDPLVEEIMPAKLSDFSGKVVGAADLILNKPVLHSGDYTFQVYGDAAQATIDISNDTHVASTFVAAEWLAFYWNRA
ncbi:hypothetical protein [Caulobacter sp.]|uniref:phage nozzle protein n=1 Tax=Caulobacter sp. TaxID=78 RepID=UPI0031DCFF24